jgi:exodeoxyribonuclease-3
MNISFPHRQRDEERLQFKMGFYDCFLEYSNVLVKHGKKLIVSGDYNTAHNAIDLKNPKNK